VKYACIARHRGEFPVRLMCRVLRVSVSGFYAAQRRDPSARAQRDQALLVQVRAAHRRSRRRYGAPRVHRDLVAQGERVGKKRVAGDGADRGGRLGDARGGAPRDRRVHRAVVQPGAAALESRPSEPGRIRTGRPATGASGVMIRSARNSGCRIGPLLHDRERARTLGTPNSGGTH